MESKSYRHLKGNVESVNEEGEKMLFLCSFSSHSSTNSSCVMAVHKQTFEVQLYPKGHMDIKSRGLNQSFIQQTSAFLFLLPLPTCTVR